MTERTFNIIMCCKGKLYPEVEGGIDRIKMYMSEECDCSPEDYGWVELKQVMQEAALDYIDTCDKPSAFLRSILCNKVSGIPIALGICVAFKKVSVRDESGNYVNGFTEELYSTLSRR